MTWQERLFEISPSLVISGSIGDLPLTIKGDVTDAEDGDVFEVRMYVRVQTNETGHTKMTDIGDFTGDQKNERKAGVVKAFSELIRRVPAGEWEDMRKMELLSRARVDDAPEEERRPRAV